MPFRLTPDPGPKIRVLDVCSGSKSLGKACALYPDLFEYTSLDINPRTAPDICADLNDWELPAEGSYDLIWCSPDCSQYSRARANAAFKPRDLERADRLVRRCVELVDTVKPRFAVFENPSTGLLYDRGIIPTDRWPRNVVDYCAYGYFYRKSTCLWTNINFEPRRCRRRTCWAVRQNFHLGRVGGNTNITRREDKMIASVPPRLLCELLESALSDFHHPQ